MPSPFPADQQQSSPPSGWTQGPHGPIAAPPVWQPTPPPAPEELSEESRFVRAAQAAGIPVGGVTKELLVSLLEQAGVDTANPAVQAVIENYVYSDPNADDATRQRDVETATWLASQLAMNPEYRTQTAVTIYSQALEESGFGTAGYQMPPSAAYYQSAEYKRRAAGPPTTPPAYITQPETGWIIYRNGVLFDPSTGQVTIDPTSHVPGSPLWLQGVQSWSGEQVSSWRKKLYEYGYLSEEQSKGTGVDQVFLTGLQQYHYSRYQNFGRAIPYDLSLTRGGVGEITVTAKDFQNQIRNDVKAQFLRIFGEEPSDAELESWTRFVTQKSIDLQRFFVRRRDVSPETALSYSSSEAEEAMVSRLESSPTAEYAEDRYQENTSLRDAITQAVQVTRSLAS